jgi:Transposase DDE domain group 1
LKVMRDGRPVTVEVTADGAGLVSHAGAALLGQVADRVGLTRALSVGLAGLKQRRRGHDPGGVIRDLSVMVAGGGECVSDLGATRDRDVLFGGVASDSTAFRTVEKIASTPGMLEAVRHAHARARARFWELHGAPERLTIDVDATLITSHSAKENAAGNYKHGYGFHPLGAYVDETREALALLLRPGNAGSNTAADHKTVIDRALAQIPAEQIETIEILIRADVAGATHETADHCHDANLRFSFGYELTEQVRAAILQIPDDAWVPALDQDGTVRENGEVVQITHLLDLSSWPEGSRVIVRRERPHPGAQLSFTDHDGYRFQAILTDQTDGDIAVLERRHRQRARVEDRIRDDKDTGLAKLPFKAFALNEVWLEVVMLAHDLLVWTQALVLEGELARAEPKRLRYRLLHVGARLAFSGRQGKLHLPADWPWIEALKAAPPTFTITTASTTRRPPPESHLRTLTARSGLSGWRRRSGSAAVTDGREKDCWLLQVGGRQFDPAGSVVELLARTQTDITSDGRCTRR